MPRKPKPTLEEAFWDLRVALADAIAPRKDTPASRRARGYFADDIVRRLANLSDSRDIGELRRAARNYVLAADLAEDRSMTLEEAERQFQRRWS